ncbi:uncharacterized protein LOC116617750 isoform X2 [Nematostella vectensis]|uniref:uncharacterized protein LOC116617750 isoform X2 n=1 Tax=Nematostella vectensis TaxID=45351 RepID=UPI00207750AB|nr:uncharacterized protein LOC116617750 isoform X2 [Nematostella vectensis]
MANFRHSGVNLEPEKKGFYVLNRGSLAQNNSTPSSFVSRQINSPQIQGRFQSFPGNLPQITETFSTSQVPQGHFIFIPAEDANIPSTSEVYGDISQGANLNTPTQKRWSGEETKRLLRAYKELHKSLFATKSSRAKKVIWEEIHKRFCRYCINANFECNKTVAQAKEKCRSLIDKYKTILDNNKTGSDNFEFFNIIDECFNAPDPPEVKNDESVKENKSKSGEGEENSELESEDETEDQDQDRVVSNCLQSPSNCMQFSQDCLQTAPVLHGDSPYPVMLDKNVCPVVVNNTPDTQERTAPSENRTQDSVEEPARKRMRPEENNPGVLSSVEAALVGMLDAQQKAFERMESKDDKMLKMMETMVKLYAEGEKRHQEFMAHDVIPW